MRIPVERGAEDSNQSALRLDCLSLPKISLAREGVASGRESKSRVKRAMCRRPGCGRGRAISGCREVVSVFDMVVDESDIFGGGWSLCPERK